MPTRDGGWVVIEINGAVEFTDEYSIDRDIFRAVVDGLLSAVAGARERQPRRSPSSAFGVIPVARLAAADLRRGPNDGGGRAAWAALL